MPGRFVWQEDKSRGCNKRWAELTSRGTQWREGFKLQTRRLRSGQEAGTDMIKRISGPTENPNTFCSKRSMPAFKGQRESSTALFQVRPHLENWVLSSVPRFSKDVDMKAFRGGWPEWRGEWKSCHARKNWGGWYYDGTQKKSMNVI